VRRFFQIRYNNKPVDQHLYSSLHEASGVLVRRRATECGVVELDTPAGAVVRRFTFDECEEIIRSSSGTYRSYRYRTIS
jgi:hypothetical protein